MSAIEQSPVERRRFERIRPTSGIRVMLGRGNGTIIDLSSGGMRIRHSFAAMRGTQIRVAFEWQRERFDANAEVLASRVAMLGNGGGTPTMFETRLRFAQMSDDSRELLERVLAAIRSQELRRWIANMQGWSDEAHGEKNSHGDGAFLRCLLLGRQWKKIWTHDPTQPPNGFLLPATVSALEIETLCHTYSHAEAEERNLIRLMAEEAVREAVSPAAVAV